MLRSKDGAIVRSMGQRSCGLPGALVRVDGADDRVRDRLVVGRAGVAVAGGEGEVGDFDEGDAGIAGVAGAFSCARFASRDRVGGRI